MEAWVVLFHVLILLASALALGTLMESLKQSAIVGYLLGGMLVGPYVLGWVEHGREVDVIAELGAALLLFNIGLEFSFRRLMRMGSATLMAGALQIGVTALIGFAVILALGQPARPAMALGIMVALSSTACVISVLMDQTQIDSQHGRGAVGILLMQDMAVVPAILLVTALGGSGGAGQTLGLFTVKLLLSAILFGILFAALNYLAPRLLSLQSWSRNRDFPIVLTVVVSIGSAWTAHAFGLNPAFGAFLAGLLLAESPFSTQIRSDVGPLRALLVTLFFAAIGLFGDPLWVLQHWWLVGLASILVLLFKAGILHAILRLLRRPPAAALATAVSVSQVGEFSFVLAATARASGLLGEEIFKLVVSVTFLTLLATPYLVRYAPALGDRLARRGGVPAPTDTPTGEPASSHAPDTKAPAGPRILLIGLGPAGRRTAELLQEKIDAHVVCIDQNLANGATAREIGIDFLVGDASQAEVLEHAGIHHARAVVVTLPDPRTCRQVIHQCRSLAPHTPVVARARYHIFCERLEQAGAAAVVDEESRIGRQLARAVRQQIEESPLG